MCVQQDSWSGTESLPQPLNLLTSLKKQNASQQPEMKILINYHEIINKQKVIPVPHVWFAIVCTCSVGRRREADPGAGQRHKLKSAGHFQCSSSVSFMFFLSYFLFQINLIWLKMSLPTSGGWTRRLYRSLQTQTIL